MAAAVSNGSIPVVPSSSPGLGKTKTGLVTTVAAERPAA
jgi:hypothetical protein